VKDTWLGESNAYPQSFVSFLYQQIFSSVRLGGFYQLFGPLATFDPPPEAQESPFQAVFDDFPS